MSSYFFSFGTQLSDEGAKEEMVVKCMFFEMHVTQMKTSFSSCVLFFFATKIFQVRNETKNTRPFETIYAIQRFVMANRFRAGNSKYNMAGMIKCLK
jgi:hypothetical protein